jgi:3-oxoacyl-[acyl-carrier-protein] synthase III
VTDGPRLYYPDILGGRVSPAQVSTTGGESVPVPTDLPNPEILDISPTRSALLVASRIILQKNQLTSQDIHLLLPHQANARIIRGTAERLGLREDQFMINLHKYGNTTAATIPLVIAGCP